MVRYLMALVFVVGMSTLAKADLVQNITLTFTTPTTTTNTLETTLDTDFGSDTQTATILSASTVIFNLDCTFDPVTRAITSVNYLDFNGGTMKFSEETYTRYSYTYDMNSARGPFDTIPTQGTTTSGTPGAGPTYTLETTFPTSQHNIKLNSGNFTMIPPVGDDVVYNLATSGNNLTCNTASETATITTELDHVDGVDAYYNVSMEFPVDFTASFATNDAYLKTFACNGTLAAEGSFTVTLVEPPLAPVAEPDYYTVNKNSDWVSYDIAHGVLANDWDPNTGDTLTAEKTPVDYWTDPPHGRIQYYYEDGRFQYKPDRDYSGPDSFTYRVYDQGGLWDEGTVHIQVGSPISVPGDTNGDNIVDATDVAVLDDHWMESHSGPENGDFNDDGFVDADDASILAANWGNHNEGEGNVPEPSTVILLLTGLLAVGLSRRRAA